MGSPTQAATLGRLIVLLFLFLPAIFLFGIFISWPLAFTCVSCVGECGERRKNMKDGWLQLEFFPWKKE